MSSQTRQAGRADAESQCFGDERLAVNRHRAALTRFIPSRQRIALAFQVECLCMAKQLPFRVTTSSGAGLDFEFPLHPDTQSPVQVANLVSTLLAALDSEIQLQGRVGNGDILQAAAMVLAIRTRMLAAEREQLDSLVKGLLNSALGAAMTVAEGSPGPKPPKGMH